MSEYYDALASAVANLKPADQTARYAFYDRARKLVVQRLQAVDPPMADADIRTEMNAFNAAIRQLENDIVKPRRPPAPPKQAPAAPVPPPPPAARPVPPPPPAPSLEIPREFVGEAPIEPETADVLSAEQEPDAAESVPLIPPARDTSMRRLGLVVGLALIGGVLAAGAYVMWGRQSPPRPVARPTAPASPSTTSSPGTTPAPIRVAARDPGPSADTDNKPYILRRQLVFYRTNHPPGTVVISKSQNFLYVVKPNSTAMRYTVGMGPDTSEASGLYQISRKDSAADGMYLGDTKFRIKQSNAPVTIGRPSPSPGFQLVGDDFGDLYDHTELGTRVVVTN